MEWTHTYDHEGAMPPEPAQPLVKIRGRGAAWNPPNRFEPIEVLPDGDELDREYDEEAPGPRTVFLRDTSKSIIARNDSPDVPFETSVNPYRGCEHGCPFDAFILSIHEHWS